MADNLCDGINHTDKGEDIDLSHTTTTQIYDKKSWTMASTSIFTVSYTILHSLLIQMELNKITLINLCHCWMVMSKTSELWSHITVGDEPNFKKNTMLWHLLSEYCNKMYTSFYIIL